MAIRFKDQSTQLGQIVGTLQNATTLFSGTFVPAVARTGTIASPLQPATSSIVGVFQTAPNRVGTISPTLGGATSIFTGSSVAPGGTQTPSWAVGNPLVIDVQAGVSNDANAAALCTNGQLFSTIAGGVPAGTTLGANGHLTGVVTGSVGSVTYGRLRAYAGSADTLESSWLARSTRSGVTRAVRFNTLAEVNAASSGTSGNPARVTWDQTVKRSGAGSLKTTMLDSDFYQQGNEANARHYLQANQAKFSTGQPFFVQYGLRPNSVYIRHTFAMSGGSTSQPKFSIVSQFVGSSRNYEWVCDSFAGQSHLTGYHQNGNNFPGWDQDFGSGNFGDGSGDFRWQPKIDNGANPLTGSDTGTGGSWSGQRQATARYGIRYNYQNAGSPDGKPSPFSGGGLLIPDTWHTILMWIYPGTAGNPNTQFRIWLAQEGQDYVMLHENLTAVIGGEFTSNGGYEAIWFTNSHTDMVAETSPSRGTATCNYTELIVQDATINSQMIPAPGFE